MPWEGGRNRKTRKSGNLPYAVVGGNAVAAWVSRVDQAAVRNTQDVDIVLRRADLAAAREEQIRFGESDAVLAASG